jgi:opine dehydrogenase
MKQYEIAVIGAGHGGRAFAVYLSASGHKVNLIFRSPENISKIQYTKKIVTEGAISGAYSLNMVTNDYAKAISHADLILFVVPASIHLDITRKILPYLKSRQILILNPGRTWGAIEVYNEIRRNRPSLKVFVGETQTLLFTCRKNGDYGVTIHKIKNRVDYCFYPEYETHLVENIIETEFPQFHAVDDIRLTSLNNFGAMLHPPIMLLNAGSILRNEKFLFYREGVTKELSKIIEGIDRERLSILGKMNLELISFLEWVQNVYGYSAISYYDAFQHLKSYATIDSPQAIYVRYLTEDIPTGLVPLASLGRYFGSKTPIINSLITIGDCLLGTKYMFTGRTLERVGVPAQILTRNINLNVPMKSIENQIS